MRALFHRAALEVLALSSLVARKGSGNPPSVMARFRVRSADMSLSVAGGVMGWIHRCAFFSLVLLIASDARLWRSLHSATLRDPSFGLGAQKAGGGTVVCAT